MFKKGLDNFRTLVDKVMEGWHCLPVLWKEPRLLYYWLRSARKAQIALAATILLIPLLVIPVIDGVIDALYPNSVKKQMFGLLSTGKPNQERAARKYQARILFWTLGTGTVLVLLILDAPRALAAALSEESRRSSGDDSEATIILPADNLGVGQHGRYLPGAMLGRGAMGVVYRGLDRVLDREVALKELPLMLATDPDFAERFRQEARTLAQLSHSGIVQIFDLIEDRGRLLLAMELVHGGCLEDLLRERGALTVAEAARYGHHLAEALSYVHARGVIHRDLKPANVLLDGSGLPKITDFGIARQSTAQGLTQQGALLGSPAYMSPEQAAGGPTDARSDIYSLGILLYRMLTGVNPFIGDVSSVLAQQITQEPVPPAQLQKGLPAELNHLVMSLLNKDPDRREQDLKRVASLLQQYETGKV
ncbi:MAG: hypothetical protein A2091_02700 [Desulfuromonadales bacterium GWD2_61_12]|nr:MAG: hypothetical protein A2005_10895 [Desulfuromonadales bacterium GWC2_61_20]OGR35826.1 MAG: hypothetical protein A2091_02700 [Desulfuromonadales bacterium GWD2_61_12]